MAHTPLHVTTGAVRLPGSQHAHGIACDQSTDPGRLLAVFPIVSCKQGPFRGPIWWSALHQPTCVLAQCPALGRRQEKLNKLEAELGEHRGGMALGYTPPGAEFQKASSVQIANKIRTDADEGVRKAAWEVRVRLQRCLLAMPYARLPTATSCLPRRPGQQCRNRFVNYIWTCHIGGGDLPHLRLTSLRHVYGATDATSAFIQVSALLYCKCAPFPCRACARSGHMWWRSCARSSSCAINWQRRTDLRTSMVRVFSMLCTPWKLLQCALARTLKLTTERGHV